MCRVIHFHAALTMLLAASACAPRGSSEGPVEAPRSAPALRPDAAAVRELVDARLQLLEPLPDLPARVFVSPEVALGERLFFDARLSADDSMSCASCHVPEAAFSDGRRAAVGRGGRPLARNTPALLNLEGRAPYFWDGRAATLEEQALVPLTNPAEMGSDLSQLEEELSADPAYAASFRAAFGAERVTRELIAKAIAAYERTLVSGPSRFDRYLEGDASALTPEEEHGLQLFAGKAECTTCHAGPLLTDSLFHSVGLPGDDPGRAEPSGSTVRATFRTPSLRDVARTGPWFHDGSAATLEDVIEHYARGGDRLARGARDIHPIDLTDVEKRALVAFLRALDGGPIEYHQKRGESR